MYTFQPLPDLSNVHTGFYIVLTLCTVIFSLISWLVWLLSETKWGRMIIVLPVAVGCFLAADAASVSYNTMPPKNEKVTGKFKGYMSEGYRAQSGKSKADFHYLYVVYEVPEGEVTMLAAPGNIYPPLAVLYKN